MLMRTDINHLLGRIWMVVFLLWFVTAIRSKRTTQSHEPIASRAAVWIVWLGWLLMFGHGMNIPWLQQRFAPMTDTAAYAGFAIALAGMGLAVWARFLIGQNWSALIELKADHQLIRTGPYSIVRHPIYSGFMLATLGTAIAYGEVSGLVGFILVLGAWGYKAQLEERVLREHFGAEYERYQQEVKGLIPFVW